MNTYIVYCVSSNFHLLRINFFFSLLCFLLAFSCEEIGTTCIMMYSALSISLIYAAMSLGYSCYYATFILSWTLSRTH